MLPHDLIIEVLFHRYRVVELPVIDLELRKLRLAYERERNLTFCL